MSTPPFDDRTSRWALIRDLSVFVLKAGLEAVRDLILIPVTIGAGALGLLFERRDPGRYFRAVLEAGRRFDDWLNLFGNVEWGPGGSRVERATRSLTRNAGEPRGADALVARFEAVILEQHQRGGITTQAADAIDRALDSLHSSPKRASDAAGPRPEGGDDGKSGS